MHTKAVSFLSLFLKKKAKTSLEQAGRKARMLSLSLCLSSSLWLLDEHEKPRGNNTFSLSGHSGAQALLFGRCGRKSGFSVEKEVLKIPWLPLPSTLCAVAET